MCAAHLLHGFFDVNVVDDHPSNLGAVEEEFSPGVSLCCAWKFLLVDSEDVLCWVSHDHTHAHQSPIVLIKAQEPGSSLVQLSCDPLLSHASNVIRIWLFQ